MPAHRKCSHDGPRFSNGTCKQCHIARRRAKRQADPNAVNAYNKSRRMENPEKENSYGVKYRKSEKFAVWYALNRPRELWKKAKQRAEKSGREFTVSVQDVEHLLSSSSACPYTGMPYVSTRGRSPWAASLDRRDNTKGYTLGNIEITSLWWNLAKNSWPPEVMDAAVRGLRSYKTQPLLTP